MLGCADSECARCLDHGDGHPFTPPLIGLCSVSCGKFGAREGDVETRGYNIPSCGCLRANPNILCPLPAKLLELTAMSATPPIYLDHNATSPPTPAVVEAVRRAMVDAWGNPSSPHVIGRRARAILANARDAVASLANCDPERLLFTSGATESCNHLIRAARRPSAPPPTIITTTIEHAAVTAACERESRAGRPFTAVGVNVDGLIDLTSLEDVVSDGNALVSVQWANNEVGVIQPVKAIAAICARHGAMLHIDACQAFGKLAVDFDALGADFISVSGHKIGAPTGIGALYVRDCRLLVANRNEPVALAQRICLVLQALALRQPSGTRHFRPLSRIGKHCEPSLRQRCRQVRGSMRCGRPALRIRARCCFQVLTVRR